MVGQNADAFSIHNPLKEGYTLIFTAFNFTIECHQESLSDTGRARTE
jgi:hypothetical protein